MAVVVFHFALRFYVNFKDVGLLVQTCLLIWADGCRIFAVFL